MTDDMLYKLKENGLDEGFAVAYNDIDFCLKIREKGKLIVIRTCIWTFNMHIRKYL